MQVDPGRIAQLIRGDMEQRREGQEVYAQNIGLSQTQISRLVNKRMPRISGDVLVKLMLRFGRAPLGGERGDEGTRDALPSEGLWGPAGWRDAMREDQTYREAWPKVHRLWVMSKKAGSQASENWEHLVKQIDMLLRLAQAEEGSPRKRRRRG